MGGSLQVLDKQQGETDANANDLAVPPASSPFANSPAAAQPTGDDKVKHMMFATRCNLQH